MRFLLAGVILMVGCFLMAGTTVDAQTGRAVFDKWSRGQKIVGCLLAVVAVCMAAKRTKAERMLAMTFVRHASSDDEQPESRFRVVRDDEVPF